MAFCVYVKFLSYEENKGEAVKILIDIYLPS